MGPLIPAAVLVVVAMLIWAVPESTGNGDSRIVVLNSAEPECEGCRSVDWVLLTLVVSELPAPGALGVTLAFALLDLPEDEIADWLMSDAGLLASIVSDLTGKRIDALVDWSTDGFDTIGTGMMGFGIPDSAVVVVMDSDSETPVGLMVEPVLAVTFEFVSVERFSVDWVSVSSVIIECAAVFVAGVDTTNGSVCGVVDCAVVFVAGVDTTSGSVGVVVVGPTGSVGFESTEGVTVGSEGTVELVEDCAVLTGSVVVCDTGEEGFVTAMVVSGATVGVVSGVVVVRVVDPP